MLRAAALLALALAACGGSGATGGDGGTPGTLANGLSSGTWDVNFSRTEYNSATLVVKGDSATLTLVLRDEGDSVGGGCRYAESRREINLSLAGSGGMGSITRVTQLAGDGCDTAEQRSLESTYTVAHAGGGGFADLSGSWTLSGGGTTVHFSLSNGEFSGDATGFGSSTSSYTFTGLLAAAAFSGTDNTGSEFAAMRR